MAVPKDEPRLETLRESPEISPCCCSGKLDCTRLTEGVSMSPRPSPINSSPGANATTREDAAHEGEQDSDSRRRDDEARDDQSSLRASPGEPLRTERRRQHTKGCRGEDQAGPRRARPQLLAAVEPRERLLVRRSQLSKRVGQLRLRVG